MSDWTLSDSDPRAGGSSSSGWTLHDAEPMDPTQGMSGASKFFAGMGKAFTDLPLSLRQLQAEAGKRGLPLPGMPPLSPEQWSKVANSLEQEASAKRATDSALMQTGAGMAGDITGQVLPTLAVPFGSAAKAASLALPGAAGRAVAGSGLVDAALTGAVQAGLLNPTTAEDSRLIDAVKGGGLGMGGQLVGKVFGLLTQKAVPDQTRAAALSWLKDYGAKFRPSDVSGSWVGKQLDRVLEAMPGSNWIYRDVAQSQQDALNRALTKTIGDTGAGYTALGAVKPVSIDDPFLAQMAQAPQAVAKVGAGDLPKKALASAADYAGNAGTLNPAYVKFVGSLPPTVVKALGGLQGVAAEAARQGIPERLGKVEPLLPLGSPLPITGPLGATDSVQALRSMYAQKAHEALDRPTADVYSGIKNAFDDLLERQRGSDTLPSGQTVGDFVTDLRQRYGVEKLLQPASTVTEDGVSYSLLKAANAIRKLRQQEPAKWSALSPDKQEVLSNVAQLGDILRPAPSSGTAQQRMLQDLIKMGALGSVGALAGNELGNLKEGMATAFAAPALLGLLATRRANTGIPGQWAAVSPEVSALISQMTRGTLAGLANPALASP